MSSATETIVRIRRLKTPEECRHFAVNAKKAGREELVPECLLREAELLAARKAVPAQTELERRLVRDMCLIEQLSGKRLTRTWPMIGATASSVLSNALSPSRVHHRDSIWR
jgi:hypothetical protein